MRGNAAMDEPATKIHAIVILDDSTAIKDVVENFSIAGFETTEIVGGSLLVSADKTLFEQVFDIGLVQGSEGAHYLEAAEENSSTKLPLNNLETSFRRHIRAVELQKPIDFGPTSF